MSTNTRSLLKNTWAVSEPILAFALLAFLVTVVFGDRGYFATALSENAGWKYVIYMVLMTHLTITAMSLCFHRMHTHQGVKLHPVVDTAMQLWLWFTTSMSKLDWVSVHVYHHTHSDTDLDPHSPVKKGLARIFFLGVADYVNAKNHPDVIRIRKRIPENRLERFIDQNKMGGPILTAAGFTIAFGPLYGLLFATSTFLISPLFAVGGVNAIAHYFGYRNHVTTDNSRNIGFLFPLNWMICGELDHNNHHAHPKSCSFQHRWYEFDIGYQYLRLLSLVGLAELKVVYSDNKKRALAAAQEAAVAAQEAASAALAAAQPNPAKTAL